MLRIGHRLKCLISLILAQYIASSRHHEQNEQAEDGSVNKKSLSESRQVSNLIHTRIFEATSEATNRLVLLSSIKTGKHNFENLQQSICRVLLNINDFAFYVFNMRFILHSSLIH